MTRFRRFAHPPHRTDAFQHGQRWLLEAHAFEHFFAIFHRKLGQLGFELAAHGDDESAMRWLRSSRPALGGETPLELAKTDIGVRQVETLIEQVRHGVYV